MISKNRLIEYILRFGSLNGMPIYDEDYPDEGLFYSREDFIDNLNPILYMFQQIYNDKYINIYRSLKLNTLDSLDREYLGESWSFDIDSAINFGNNVDANYLIIAQTNHRNIDWYKSIALYFMFSYLQGGDAENELVVIESDDKNVNIKEINEIREMKKYKIPKLHEQDMASVVGDQAYAQELLNIQTWYNQEKKRIDDMLAKKRSDALMKYQTRSSTLTQQKQQQQQQQQQKTVDTTGKPTSSSQTSPTVESYKPILKIYENKYSYNEENLHEIETLKDYLDAENISYIEYDDNVIEFDKDLLDNEWKEIVDDILIVEDEEDDNDEIEEYENFFKTPLNLNLLYVKIKDGNKELIGKIFKKSDNSEWESKLLSGKSKTFEKLNYDKTWDEIDIISFLRENYDDADLLDEVDES